MCRTLGSKWVETRKPHYCYGCANQFPSKSLLERCTGIDSNGDIYSNYWCLDCTHILEAAYDHNAISSFCDEFPEPGEIKYWLQEPEGYGISEVLFTEISTIRENFLEAIWYIPVMRLDALVLSCLVC